MRSALLFALGLTQSTYTWVSTDKSLTIKFESISIQQLKGARQRLVLSAKKTPVTVSQPSRGIELSGKSIEIVALTIKREVSVEAGTVTGGAKILLVSEDNQNANCTSNRLDYVAKGSAITAKGTGSVVINIDSAVTHQAVHLEGAKGMVSGLIGGKGSKISPRDASIEGNITATLTNLNLKKASDYKTISAKGDRATYQVGIGATGILTVFGVRDVQGLLGDGHATLTGSHRLTITIDAHGVAQKVDLTEDRP